MRIIKTGQEARDKLKKGIDLVCDCVKATIGPAGRNVVIGRVDIPPIITNDGVSTARNIEAEDEIENQGCWIVKEALSVASGKAGDGTTTTAVLLQAIIAELFDRLKDNGSLIASKVNAMQLMKEVDAACKEIVEKLKEQARPITIDEIYNVAMVSGEFEWLAKMVAEVYEKIGKDGYVTIEEGVRNSYETFKGIELNAGYHSEYYQNKGDQCIIENPHILVTNNLLDASFVLPLITELGAKGITEVIFIAPDFTKDMLNRLITTKVKAGFTALALKLPTFDKDDLLIDIATLTKAKFLDKNTYTKIEDFIADIKFSSLGKADKAVIDSGKTVIIGGDGDTKERVEKVKKQRDETLSLFDKDMLDKRIAYLSGGIATVKIGGESDFEKTYFKLKAENAFSSAQVALKDGVVKGGGLALKELSTVLPNNILANAIKEPYNQIQKNAGGIEIGAEVIDPVAVTISSLESACSIAGRVITTEVVTAFKNESKDKDKN